MLTQEHELMATSSRNARLREVAEEIEADVVTLYLYDAPNASLVLWATYGLAPEVIGYRMALTQGLTGLAARNQRPLSVKHPHEHPAYHHVRGSYEERYQSYLGLPLFVHGELTAVMVVQTVAPKVYLLSEIESLYAVGKTLIAEVFEQAGAHVRSILKDV